MILLMRSSGGSDRSDRVMYLVALKCQVFCVVIVLNRELRVT